MVAADSGSIAAFTFESEQNKEEKDEAEERESYIFKSVGSLQKRAREKEKKEGKTTGEEQLTQKCEEGHTQKSEVKTEVVESSSFTE